MRVASSTVSSVSVSADLVHLDEHGVGDGSIDALLEPADVRHEEVVADELHVVADGAGQLGPSSQSSSAMPSSIETIGYVETSRRQ